VSIELEYENSRTIEVGLFDNRKKIGEASMWLPSELSESLNAFGIADVEYIEIIKKYRGKCYGQAFLLEIQKELKTIGFDKFMLWTEVDNIPMKKLAQKSGFSKGPTFYWIKTEFEHSE
jgi:GNAT superfamily N-acetyltransferase